MPFNSLLLNCLEHGTSFTEKITVSVKPRTGETILFFSIDNATNKNCNFNKEFGGGRICDLLIFYKKSDIMIVFVEIKGRNVKDALKQIKNTVNKLKKVNTKNKIIWKAVIVSHTSAPKNWKSKDVKNEFKKLGIEYHNFFNKKECRIGDVLRN